MTVPNNVMAPPPAYAPNAPQAQVQLGQIYQAQYAQANQLPPPHLPPPASVAAPPAPDQNKPKASPRAKFYDDLIENRRVVDESRWDKKRIAVIIPCYNERHDVQNVLASLRDEIKFLLKRTQIERVQVYFVIDGSGSEQLATGQNIIRAFSEKFANHETVFFRQMTGGLQDAYDEFELLIRNERETSELCRSREKQIHNVAGMDALDAQISLHKSKKADIFGKSFEQLGAQFMHYPSRLLKFEFLYNCVRKNPRVPTTRNINLTLTVLVKEQHRQKRDSLLLAMHSCLIGYEIPWALAVVASDTTWQKGSLTRMANYLTTHVGVTAVTGTVISSNESWTKPLTTLQDMRSLTHESIEQEAENLFGAVNNCSGTFSMFRTQQATDPYHILPELTLKATSLGDRNKVELGIERYWTTLLMERCLFADNDRIQHNIAYLPTAVAETVTPHRVVDYILQQRRWFNSHNSNLHYTLLPKLNQQLGRHSALGLRSIGVFYLWFRSLFERTLSFLSPALCSLLILSLLRDTGMPSLPAIVLVLFFLIMGLLMVLLFPRPRDNEFIYKSYVVTSSVGMAALTGAWAVKFFGGLSAHYLDDAYDAMDKADRLRRLIFFVTFIVTVFVVVLFGRARRAFSPVHKVFMPIVFAPMQYILLPIFSLVNVADFSWGTLPANGKLGASAVLAANQQARRLLSFFIGLNSFIFSLYFIVNAAGGNALAVLFIVIQFIVILPLYVTLLLAIIAGIQNLILLLPRKIAKWKGRMVKADEM
eukprot:GILJ01013835.1.p1 GENE.GILJ01013835.1~~GILJ01013835.1.p1  ORF type:complete len:764 (-),score=121.68 GILJ01013835.1:43-2334(-)